MNTTRIGTRLVPQDGDLKAIVAETLSLIDTVHLVLDLPQTPILFTNDPIPFGRYVPGDGRPDHIELSRLGPSPRLSLAHEIGHLLDHALGNYGVYSSKMARSPLTVVMRTIDHSEAIRTFRAVIGGKQSLEPGANLRQIRYWLEPEEKWARAYAQYIATRSASPAMQAELKVVEARESVELYKRVQWTARDFEPIAVAMDRAFKRLGWRP